MKDGRKAGKSQGPNVVRERERESDRERERETKSGDGSPQMLRYA